MRKILFFIVLLAGVSQNTAVAGGEAWRDNTLLLPQYCKDRAAGRYEKWRGTFGDAYIHMHHYCSGIYAEQQAKSAVNQSERNNWLNKMIDQMKYVSSACNQRCAIYPELHTRWGWALGKQGQTAEAIQHYQLAIKARRSYSPAYARLSELYLEIDQPDEARKALELGLKASPKSSMLKRRLEELGSSG